MGPYAALLLQFALISVPSNHTSAATGGSSSTSARTLSYLRSCDPRQEVSSQQAPYKRAIAANRLFKTRIGGFRLWASAVKWTPVRTKATEKFDVALDHVTDNMQVVVITQRGSAPLSSLAGFCVQNARKSDPNSTITAVENRVVNGHELVCVTYESTLKSEPTTFYGYLYSEDQGTVEVIAMAPRDLFQTYRAELTELLNGLEILPQGTPLTEALLGPQSSRPEDLVEISPLFVRPGKDPAPNPLAQLIHPPLPASGISTVVEPLRRAPSDGPSASSAAPFPTSNTRSSTGPAAVTDVTTRPVPLNRPQPNYTEDARRERVEGIVRVRALVGTDGTITDVRLLTHLPEGLDEEAIYGVKKMQFKPATKDGQPVATWITLEVDFNMCDHCVPRPK